MVEAPARLVLAVVAELKFSDEHREKLRQAQLGKKRSPEHRAAISAGSRAMWARKHAERARETLERLRAEGR